MTPNTPNIFRVDVGLSFPKKNPAICIATRIAYQNKLDTSNPEDELSNNTNPPVKSENVENDSKNNSNDAKTETQHDFSEQITDVKMDKALEENDFEPKNAFLESDKPKKKQ